MKKFFVLLMAVLTWGSAMAQRDVISLNDGWLFRLGTNDVVGAMKASEADGWRRVDVPHDFQIEQPWVAPDASEQADNSDAGANIRSRLSSRGFKEMGEGWYVRSFTPSEDMKDKRLLLDFEGIMYVADVYVNGKHVGGTDYGYVGYYASDIIKTETSVCDVASDKSVTISRNGNNWIISNASGKYVTIYSVNGQKLRQFYCETDREEMALEVEKGRIIVVD